MPRLAGEVRGHEEGVLREREKGGRKRGSRQAKSPDWRFGGLTSGRRAVILGPPRWSSARRSPEAGWRGTSCAALGAAGWGAGAADGCPLLPVAYLVQAVRAAGKCDAVFKGFSDCLLKLGDNMANYPQGLDDKSNINTVCT